MNYFLRYYFARRVNDLIISSEVVTENQLDDDSLVSKDPNFLRWVTEEDKRNMTFDFSEFKASIGIDISRN